MTPSLPGLSHRIRRALILGALLVMLPAPFSAQGEEPVSKQDAILQGTYHRFDRLWKFHPAAELPALDPSMEALQSMIAIDLDGQEPVVPVAVTTRDTGEELEKNGFRIDARIGNLVTLQIPLSRLPALTALSSVVYVQASRIVQPQAHDVSIPETRTPLARQSFNVTGKGVVVGDIDTGIDWRHADFRNADGSTRIKFLWDLSDDTGPAPADFSSVGGTVYTESQINAALGGSGTVREADRNGHGTHTAGSAAGNGLATGNGFPARTFAGVATEADLIVVKGVRKDTGGFATNDVIAAISFIDRRARDLNAPYVINMSLGGQFGAHDGTDPQELAIDNLIGPGKPGKAIVIAAGNEGADNIHAGGTIPTGRAETVRFSVAPNQTLAYIDLWYSGSDSFDVTVVTPTNVATPKLSPGAANFRGVAPDGTTVEVGSLNQNPLNQSKEIFVVITQSKKDQPVLSGNWSLLLQRTSGDSGRFDSWTGSSRSSRFIDHLESTRKVSMPGTAKNAITVASYITKTQWTDIDGSRQSYSSWGPAFAGPAASKSPFSNAGPTRDGRQKPDIAAPGQGIASANSADSEQDREAIVADGKHKIEQGTSMATPHVTGAVALMLQLNRGLDAAQIRDALTRTARSDDFTGRVPHTDWGFGKMDVFEALKAVSPSVTTPPPPVTPDPVITSIDPNTLERGTTVQATISGSNFTGGRLTVEITPSTGITVNQAAAVSSSRINLNLTVASSAPVGSDQVIVAVDGRRSAPGTFRVVAPNTPSTDAQDAFEPNDTFQDAKPIPANGRMNARINPRADLDVFKFSATRGRKVTFDIDAQVLTPSSGLDSIVGVFDRSGNLLASNDDEGPTLDTYLEWIPTVTDTYFVLVASASLDSGPYTSGPYLLKIDGHAGDIRADSTPPVLNANSILVPQILSRTTELWGEWSAQDPESGVDHYEYAVGTSAGAANVIPFTRTSNLSIYLSGLNLQNGATYYIAVRAFNGAGLATPVQVSRGTRINTAFPSYPIYFPRVVALPGSFTGIAVSNPTTSNVQILYREFDNSGNLILGEGITNPTTTVLGPHEQLPLLSTELFGAPTANSPGWVEIQASDPNVKAFFLYGGSSFLDGADVTGNAMTDFLFHRVQESGDFIFTILSLVNPNDAAATVTADLRDKGGQIVSTQNLTLGPKQRTVKLVRDLFPGVTEQIGGSIRIRSTQPLAGFELVAANATDLGGMNPQAASEAARSLAFAHLASQGIWYTEISATNPNDSPVQVQLRANDERGALIAGAGVVNPVTVVIPGRGQYNATASETFRLTGSQAISGYVTAQVTGGIGGILGNLLFGTTSGTAVAALPVQTRSSGSFVFSQVAQVTGLFTGLTLLDTDPVAASVKTEVFSATGLSLGSRTETFQPAEKKARIISDIVAGALGQAGGFIQVNSTRPIAGFELFGSSTLSFLASVPPQTLTDAVTKQSGTQENFVRIPRRGQAGSGAEVSDDPWSLKLYGRLRHQQPAGKLNPGWLR